MFKFSKKERKPKEKKPKFMYSVALVTAFLAAECSLAAVVIFTLWTN